MPEVSVCCGESPPQTLKGGACLNMWVFCYVCIVVEVQKVVVGHLPEDCKGCHNQKETNYDFQTVSSHIYCIALWMSEGNRDINSRKP